MKCDKCGLVNPRICRYCKRCRHKLRQPKVELLHIYDARRCVPQGLPTPRPEWVGRILGSPPKTQAGFVPCDAMSVSIDEPQAGGEG